MNGKATDGAAATGAAAAPANWSEEDIREVLRQVFDPELHMNIVDLGLVYGAEQDGETVRVRITLTSPACPYGPFLLHQVRETLLTLQGIKDVDLNVVWDPPWGPDRMSEEARLELGFDV